ncbi:unnamed protein product [Protopolystoma xenopodis]|uniref:MHD1 domain-containing protein n=1 Tax=Protopolystoma xenopodis TaxID=117903 RepID=A0A3S5B1Z3_9PLAT|nr:unnamed protein product [Protopolystoma xenopodis]
MLSTDFSSELDCQLRPRLVLFNILNGVRAVQRYHSRLSESTLATSPRCWTSSNKPTCWIRVPLGLHQMSSGLHSCLFYLAHFCAQENTPPEEETAHSLRSLQFWHRLIALLVSVIEEDKGTYAAVLNQFPQELNMGHVSASCMWARLSEDLRVGLEVHANATERFCKSSDYMNLCFKTKWFYNKFVSDIADMKDHVPGYPAWFEPFVMQWLNENDEISMDYLRNAYERDKQDGFQKSSEHALFSNSVVDVFTQLNQCYDVIKKLECPAPKVQDRFLNRFSRVSGFHLKPKF